MEPVHPTPRTARTLIIRINFTNTSYVWVIAGRDHNEAASASFSGS